MARDDGFDRVFDVSKPSRVSPSPTSRPVITGHQPMMGDPMVTHEHGHELAKVTSVPVMTDDGPISAPSAHPHPMPSNPPAEPQLTPPAPPPEYQPMAAPEPSSHVTSYLDTLNHAQPDPTAMTAEPMKPQPEEKAPLFSSVDSLIGEHHSHHPHYAHHPGPKPQPPSGDDGGSVGAMPLTNPRGAGPRRSLGRTLMWLIPILVVVFGLYAYADAKTSIGLPFYIFRKTTPVVAPKISPPPPPVQPSIPTGFTFYKLTGTSITFDSPTAWGIPAATAEPGFSKRGGTNKADGTYAYVVSFPSNKDVEITVTSNKFLPPTRAATYYDFLQWCTGTADAKFYKSILHFAADAATKTDTPTTITCDQGPLTDATKVDETTIVQLKTKTPDGKNVLGDLYTKNLTDKELVVMRVKDSAMTHGQDIKSLLGTVKVGTTAQTKTP